MANLGLCVLTALMVFAAPRGGKKRPAPAAAPKTGLETLTDEKNGFSLKYSRTALSEVKLQVSHPYLSDQYEGKKLLAPATAKRLGQKSCSYASKEEPELCAAEKEPGISVVVLPFVFSELTAELNPANVEQATVAGKSALWYHLGAGGQGTDWLFVPLASGRTLGIASEYTDDYKPPIAELVKTLTIKD
jgi:hypothetical protein